MKVRGRFLGSCVAAALVVNAAQLAAQTTGHVVTDTVHSRAIAGNLFGDSPDRAVLVYLPPSYATSPAKRYPVVYLLHGYGATETSWARGYAGFRLPQTMDSLISAGATREMILVAPNARTKLGGSFYTNSTSTGGWDDFIAGELVSFIDGKYRTIARPGSRGLAGHSMGGYGAFAVGMRHAGEVYSAVYALSACCTSVASSRDRPAMWDTVAAMTSLDAFNRMSFYVRVSSALAAAFVPDSSRPPLFADLPMSRNPVLTHADSAVLTRWTVDAPLSMIATHVSALKRLKALAFDVGLQDELVAPRELVAMDSALTKAGVAHTFETYEGTHTSHIGDRLITKVLPFFSRNLSFDDR